MRGWPRSSTGIDPRLGPTKRKKAPARGPSETDECVTFVEWTKLVRFKGRPLFDRVVKIPNERGARGVAIAILTQIGMRKGFLDYMILAPVGGWSGLFLEAKARSGGTTSDEQYDWRDRLVEYGYHAEICEGSDELIAAVRRYFVRANCDQDGSWVDNVRVQT